MTHVAAQARVPKKGLLAFLIIAAVLLGLGAMTVLRETARQNSTVEIVTVVDGNTVVVNRGGRQETLTMAGVRAAVRNPDGMRVGPEFCMGEQAYAWLRDRLPQGAIATVDTSDEGAPEGTRAAVFTLAGDTVNVAMAEEGMVAPTGLGVDRSTERQIADANAVARGQKVGLYSVEERCTLPYRLFESTFALEQVPTSAANTVQAIDQRSVEYADALDAVRLVRQDIAATDPSRATFTDLAYGPAKDELLQEADATVEKGMQVLRDLNQKRNELVAR
ncbi:nuclease [Micrococcus sp.]|uniref:thermonuclease family protein n=1 Tax=Micrococcus sp. TaxID=1271 RepID=UPI002A90BD6C|nr:nuclease [Micrococcus sp.]MDY6056086.1 nuclease [Micrococcus sp.]